MNKNSKRLTIYITLTLLLTVAAVSFRTAACLTSLDFVYGYFDKKALIYTANALLISAVIFAFSYLFAGKKVELRPSFSSPATYVPTGIVGAALIFMSLRLFISVNELKGEGNVRKIVLGTAVFAGITLLLSVVHFFLNAFLTESKTELRAYFATATVIAFSAYAALLYFKDDGMALNVPNRLADQMAFITAALFFLYEARISLGREKWRGYCAFGLIALAVTAFSGFPTLIVYFAKGQMISDSLEASLVAIAIFIFITARMITTVSLPAAEKNEKISALESYAEERERIAKDTERRYDEAYAVQLTIDDMIPTEEFPEAIEDELPPDEFVFPEAEELTTVFVEEDYDSGEDAQLEMVVDLLTVTHAGDEGDGEDETDEDDGTED